MNKPQLFTIGCFIVVVIAMALLVLLICQDPEIDTLTQRFEGVLYKVTYYPVQDVWILIFADARILKVSQQPKGGWLLTRKYEIVVTPSGPSLHLMKEELDEKSQEDKENLRPGKTF